MCITSAYPPQTFIYTKFGNIKNLFYFYKKIVMELYANINQLVHIDPKLVVENLIKKELGYDKWVFEKEGKFYMGFTQGAGSHSFDDKYEITEEKYRYMQALNVILKYLEKIQL